jgi:sulfhydrogenase subunit alpha
MPKKIMHPINIDHIARIEGKAGIEVIFDKKKVDVVKVNIIEGPRFFEAIVKGKPVEEAVAVFPRVCSFCAAAHKITPVQAAETAIGITPTVQTQKLRELLYIGDYIQSHALHLHFLALPDFLGFSDALSMGKKYREVVNAGIALKDIGAEIQTVIGSRSIHQENILIGGFGKIPKRKSLESIYAKLNSLHNIAEEAVEQFVSFSPWSELDAERMHLALEPYDNTYSMFGNQVFSTDRSQFKASAYKVRIHESVVPYSFAKHGSYKEKPFMTGAISRWTLFGTRMDGRARELADVHRDFLNPNNPLCNNLAQAIEIVYYIRRAESILENLLDSFKPDELRIKSDITKTSTGISMTEAPRGLLVYALKVNKNGIVKSADIITPTAMFLPMMESDLRRMTESLVERGINDSDKIRQKLETVVRAFDPCISCSVHVCTIR